MSDDQPAHREEISRRRIERGKIELARRRARRRRILRIVGATVGVAAVALLGIYALGGFSSDDPSVAEGIALGKALTADPNSPTGSTSALERENSKLKRQIARERRKQARSDKASSNRSGSNAKGFSTLASAVNGSIGVSYGPVGSSQQTTLGSWSSGAAWSTAKVPVAVAVSRQNGGSATGSMQSAITASDNSAAEAMWSSLGSPSSAGRKADSVLSDAGDSTSIETRRVRSGFTSFGQTNWSISAQQTFAAHLPCIRGAKPVLSLMGQISSDQSWGLGNVGSNPRFKGGWGPGPGGGYLVRQFGIVNIRGGELAVAIAAEPSNGQFSTGIEDLNKVSSWIESNLRGATAQC